MARRWLGIVLALPAGIALVAVAVPALSAEGWGTIQAIWQTQSYVVRNSVAVAVAVAGLGLPLAGGLAWVRVHLAAWPAQVVEAAMFLLLAMPSFAVSTGLLVWVGHNGIFAWLWGGSPVEIYGPLGVIAANLMTFLPFAYWLLVDGFRSAHRLEADVARAFGRSRGQIFWQVTLPGLRPSLLAAGLLLFVEALADVANPLILGGDFEVLSSRIYSAVATEFDPVSGAAYALVLAIPAISVWAFGLRSRPAPGVSVPPNRIPWGRLGWPGRVLVVLVLGFSALVVALVAAVGVSAVLAADGPRLTLAPMVEVLSTVRPLAGSLLISLAVAAFSVLGGVTLAIWCRYRPDWQRGVSAAVSFGQSIPAVTLGLGALLIGWWTGIQIANWSLLAMIFVLTIRLLPSAFGSISTALLAVQSSAVDVIRLTGGGWRRVLAQVWAPQLRWVGIRSAIWSFSRSMMALNSVILLTTASTPLLSVRILRDLDSGRVGSAAAASVVIGLVVVGFAASLAVLGRVFSRIDRRTT